jgi:DNA repair photolyase
MTVREISAKTILSTSKVYDYVINPYTGCEHACTYCYARFMKRFTGHAEPWGAFVDVKTNAPELLDREIRRKREGTVWVSGVCDPYQPMEARYALTRRCLEILARSSWPVFVQTRSPLVLRDLDIFRDAGRFEVGMSVTTADDTVRSLFEPHAPPIADRLAALDALHRSGVRTYAMIAPMLPGAQNLAEPLAGKADYVIIDRMNYRHADWVFRKYRLPDTRTDDFVHRAGRDLASAFRRLNIECRTVC